MSADVTFFESVLYFSTQVPVTISETVPPSMSVPLSTPTDTASLLVSPAKTTDPLASKLVRDFRYVYTHRPKVPSFKPVLANPSPVDCPSSPPSASPFDLDTLIALQKGKWPCTDHIISNFVSYDLNPTF